MSPEKSGVGTQTQKYKGRVSVVTLLKTTLEPQILLGSSASQMTAAKTMGSRCGISLHPSEIGACSKTAQTFRSQNVQTYGYAFQRHKWPKSWSSMEDPVVPLERNLDGHPLAGQWWERQFEEVLLKHGWE